MGVSVATLRRYAKSGNWQADRRANKAIAGMVTKDGILPVKEEEIKEVALKVLQDPTGPRSPLQVDTILMGMVEETLSAAEELQFRNKESAFKVALEALKVYNERNPLTMEELAARAWAIPNFSPMAFARYLRDSMSDGAKTTERQG